MTIDFFKKHIAKIGIAGAVVMSLILVNMNIVVVPYIASLQFLHFLFMIAAAGGAFYVYKTKDKPWILIITTTAAIFNYFFTYDLVTKTGVFITDILFLAALGWNIILDVEPKKSISQPVEKLTKE